MAVRVYKVLSLFGALRVTQGNWLSVIVLSVWTRPLNLTSSHPSEKSTGWEEKPLYHSDSSPLNLKSYQETLAPCILRNWFCSGNVLSAWYTWGSGTQVLYSLIEGALLQPVCYSWAWILVFFLPLWTWRGKRQTSSRSGKVGTFLWMLFSHFGNAKRPEVNSNLHFFAVHCHKLVVHCYFLCHLISIKTKNQAQCS